MGYPQAFLTPYDEYVTGEVLSLFSKSTSDFIKLLNTIRKNFDNDHFECDTAALLALITKINDYITQKNSEVRDIINSFPRASYSTYYQIKVVTFYPPPKCTINRLIESLDGYQKTLLTYLEQLQYMFTVRLA